MKLKTSILLIASLLLLTNCADKRRSTSLSCNNKDLIGEWTQNIAAPADGIIFTANCDGYDYNCDQRFFYNTSATNLYLYSSQTNGISCFRLDHTCSYEVIGSILELKCDGLETKTYKRN